MHNDYSVYANERRRHIVTSSLIGLAHNLYPTYLRAPKPEYDEPQHDRNCHAETLNAKGNSPQQYVITGQAWRSVQARITAGLAWKTFETGDIGLIRATLLLHDRAIEVTVGTFLSLVPEIVTIDAMALVGAGDEAFARHVYTLEKRENRG